MNIKFLRAFDEDFFAIKYPYCTKEEARVLELIYRITAHGFTSNDNKTQQYRNDKINVILTCEDPIETCFGYYPGKAYFSLGVYGHDVFSARYYYDDEDEKRVYVFRNYVTPKIFCNLEVLADFLDGRERPRYDALSDDNIPASFI